jgi:hypothetical protein
LMQYLNVLLNLHRDYFHDKKISKPYWENSQLYRLR